MTAHPVAALVREVSPRLPDALLTYQAAVPIDVDRARRQHADYVAFLADRGIEVVRLPPADAHPDGVFVEDTAVIVGDLAVVTRPGDPSRRAETRSVAPALAQQGYTLAHIEPPGRLDGGDVLAIGDTLFVGVGSRTDPAGIRSLATAVAGHGRRVAPIRVQGALHLKTAVTALPDGTLLGRPDAVDVAGFAGRRLVTAPEGTGANILVLGDTVAVSASAPRTAELLAARGYEPATVAIDELEKAEAGLTCLSVLLPH